MSSSWSDIFRPILCGLYFCLKILIKKIHIAAVNFSCCYETMSYFPTRISGKYEHTHTLIPTHTHTYTHTHSHKQNASLWKLRLNFLKKKISYMGDNISHVKVIFEKYYITKFVTFSKKNFFTKTPLTHFQFLKKLNFGGLKSCTCPYIYEVLSLHEFSNLT